MINEENKYQTEKALKTFWLDHGKNTAVNAKHTYVTVEPKFIIGNRINSEIAKRIIGVYLSQITSDKIVSEQIFINNDGIKIFDEGKLVVEIVNQRFVDSVANKVTSQLGKELSKREKRSGGIYLEPKEDGDFTFGEIKQALAEFLVDEEKNDSKNMLKDAILLLMN
ncbi:MAG: hypothetical protein ABH860_06100 [bacterium]